MTLFTQVVGLWIVVNQSFVIRWDPWWTWSSECWFVSTSKPPLWICWWFQFSSVLWRDWRLCHLSKNLCNSTISGVFAVYPTFRSTSTWDYEWHVPFTAYSHDPCYTPCFLTRFSPRKRPPSGHRERGPRAPGVLNSSERDDPTELSEVSFLSRDRRGEVKLSVPGKSDQITGWFQTWLMMVNDG